MLYYKKYLKYKSKYLQFKNQFGSGIKTARHAFKQKIKIDIIKDDNLLNSILTEQNIKFDELERIFNIITEDINKDYIDDYIKIYLNKSLGKPNSIENKGRFSDAMKKIKILRDNKILCIPSQ
jgi:hypothetical protein